MEKAKAIYRDIEEQAARFQHLNRRSATVLEIGSEAIDYIDKYESGRYITGLRALAPPPGKFPAIVGSRDVPVIATRFGLLRVVGSGSPNRVKVWG